jgi:hypothetical protein
MPGEPGEMILVLSAELDSDIPTIWENLRNLRIQTSTGGGAASRNLRMNQVA